MMYESIQGDSDLYAPSIRVIVLKIGNESLHNEEEESNMVDVIFVHEVLGELAKCIELREFDILREQLSLSEHCETCMSSPLSWAEDGKARAVSSSQLLSPEISILQCLGRRKARPNTDANISNLQ